MNERANGFALRNFLCRARQLKTCNNADCKAVDINQRASANAKYSCANEMHFLSVGVCELESNFACALFHK